MIINRDKIEQIKRAKKIPLLMDIIDKDIEYPISYLFNTNLSDITMTNVLLVPLTGVNSAALKDFGYVNAYTYSNIPDQEETLSIYLVFQRDKIEENSKLSFDINFYTDRLIQQYFLEKAIILQFKVEGFEKDIKKCLDGKYSRISNKTKTALTKNTYWLDYRAIVSSPIEGIISPNNETRSIVADRLGITYPSEWIDKNSEVFSLKYKEEETLFIKKEYLKNLLF